MKFYTKTLILFFLLFFIKFFNASATELGLTSVVYSKNAKKQSKESSAGIQKGLIQLDFSINLGSNGPFYVNERYKKGYPKDYVYRYGIGFRPGFTLNIDGAVHKYASVGAYLGFDGSNRSRVIAGNVYYNRNIGIAFGARGVFHIYQLISDKTNTKADPGKLDFYFALHMGGIVYINTNNDFVNDGYRRSYGGFSAGPSIGVRYYFNSKIGIISEVGWNEMSVFKFGLAVKL